MIEAVEKGTEYVMKILMEIKEDVASIKTDVKNLKDNSAKDSTLVNDRLDKLEAKVHKNTIDIDNLSNQVNTSEDKKDAKRYRAIIAYMLTAIGGVFIAKLPDMIKALYLIFMTR